MTANLNPAASNAADLRAEQPFDILTRYFKENEAIDASVRETAFAINAKLLSLNEVTVGAQATILNKPAALLLEAREGSDDAKTTEALQQLETCRIGTCQGIIFDVNSLQVSVSQLDRLGGADGDRRSQSLVEPTLSTIRDDLALLHFTTLARAGMLCAADDAEGCMKALGEYAAFLDGTILQNVVLFERLSVNGEAWRELGNAAAAFKKAVVA